MTEIVLFWLEALNLYLSLFTEQIHRTPLIDTKIKHLCTFAEVSPAKIGHFCFNFFLFFFYFYDQHYSTKIHWVVSISLHVQKKSTTLQLS